MAKNKEKKNYSIKCDVTSCVHNNCDANYCKLDEIEVSCNCCDSEVSDKEDTICNSYECIEKED